MPISEGAVPPDYYFEGCENVLIDVSTGVPIGQIDYHGRWAPAGDGVMMREEQIPPFVLLGHPGVSAAPASMTPGLGPEIMMLALL